MKDLWILFASFCRIGGLTFGGGYAMLPMLQKELVEKYGWVTEEELLDYFAIGQCTPGIIAVNTATFIGYKRRGIIGGLVATLGVIFPSLIIITIIAAVLQNFSDIPAVQHAFGGIRVAVCALIISAVLKLWKKSVVDVFCGLIFLASLMVMIFLSVSPIIIVVISAALGILIQMIRSRKEAEKA